MAFVKNYELILEKVQKENLPFYQILDNDGKTIIDENNDPDVSAHEAVKKMQDIFDNITGTVIIKLCSRSKEDKAKGGPARNITLTTKIPDTSNNSNIQGIGAVSPNIAEIEARIEEKYNQKLEAYKREQDLLRRIEKLEAEKNEGSDLEKYMPLIAGIFGNQMPTPLAGNDPNINGPGNEVHERINNAIKILYKNDKNFVSNLEKLAQISQNNPLVYAVAIEKLKEY